MRNFFVRRAIVTGTIFAVLGIGALVSFVFFNKVEPETIILDKPIEHILSHEVIGFSVLGRDIDVYTYSPSGKRDGSDQVHIIFVGGIHGGYEWNSVVLAYEFLDYLEANQSVVPPNITVTVIPSANPDGVYKVIGKEGRFASADVPSNVEMSSGRFNANEVDLNRNFDCKWKPESAWRGAVVSAGTSAFSEPETKAIRDFVLEENPDAVIFWHSQADAVYASECEDGILAETLNIMNVYARSSGYSAVSSFDAYEISGDAEGWLASIGIPAITVELKTHETVEWEENLRGIKSLFEYYR